MAQVIYPEWFQKFKQENPNSNYVKEFEKILVKHQKPQNELKSLFEKEKKYDLEVPMVLNKELSNLEKLIKE